MRRRRLVALVSAALGILAFAPVSALASSHREAPTIATDPAADNTDVYAFVSPERQDTVTLIANYYPIEVPAGGPNFYRLGDDVRYDIHVDNVGDATDHVVFSVYPHTSTVSGGTFLYNTGLMSFNGTGFTNWNRPQVYDLKMTVNGVTTTLGTNLLSPPDNVGPRSVGGPAAYDAMAKASVAKFSDGIWSFMGQRSESFFVDLGGVFDLLHVNPTGGTNYLAGLNVHTIAIQVPKSMLEGPNGDHVIGVWATASRHGTTTLVGTSDANNLGQKTYSSDWVQVSRLGNPLVNEVVIDYKYKDAFNAISPSVDHTLPEVVARVTDPELAALFVALGIDANAPQHGRTDLVTTFLTGIPGLNKPNNSGQVASEMLRLNMSIPPSSTNPNAVNRMGVLGGQPDGFPNGRRPADDVTDIALQAVDGILCQQGGALQGANPACRPTPVPVNLGDGVNAADVAFQTCFPYLANPHGPNGSGAPVSSCPGAVFPATSVSRAPGYPLLVMLGLLLLALCTTVAVSAYRRKANA